MPCNGEERHDPAETLLRDLTPQETSTIGKQDSDLLDDEAAAEMRNKELVIKRQDQIIREKDQELSERHEEHELRKTYIETTFVFVVGVTFASLFIAVAAGLGWLKMSDAVLITILTTTIANVLGCLLIAFKWLFPSKER